MSPPPNQPRRYGIWNHATPDTTKPAEAQTPAARPSTGATSALYDRIFADRNILEPIPVLFDPTQPTKVALKGHRLLPDGSSAPCVTKSISQNEVDVTCLPPLDILSRNSSRAKLSGTRLTLDLEKIGKFNGLVTQETDDGFKLAVDDEYRSRLAEQLAEIANPTPKIERIEPEFKSCEYMLPNGETRKAKLINISPRDALLRAVANRPEIGTPITFRGKDRLKAEITRTFEIGFEIKFVKPIPAEIFSRRMKLVDEPGD